MELTATTISQVEQSGRTVELRGTATPAVPMWCVYRDTESNGIRIERIVFVNLYQVHTAGGPDYAIAAPVICENGVGLYEECGYEGDDFIGVTTKENPDPREWLARHRVPHR